MEEQIYNEIFTVLDTYKDKLVFNIDELKTQATLHLFGLKLQNEYKLDINPKEIYSQDYQRLKNNICIGMFGVKHNRKIFNQPSSITVEDSELLLTISFSSGAYMFGDDYPTELFNEMFEELMSYSPKYIDYTNNYLYFSMNNAGKVFNDFDNILKKYIEKNKIDKKEREIKKLEKQLKQLKS